MSRIKRDIEQAIAAAGGELVALEQTKHIKTRIRRPDGSLFAVVWAVSLGDGARGWKNQLALLRRRMQEVTQ